MQISMRESREHNAAGLIAGRVTSCLSWLDQLSQRLVLPFLGAAGSRDFASVLADAESDQETVMQQTMFAYAAAVVGVHLMRADGEVNLREHKSFLAMFMITGVAPQKMKSLLVAASKDNAPLSQYLHQLGNHYNDDESMRQQLLMRFARVALADGPLCVKEYDVLSQMGKAFGFDRKQVAGLIDKAEGPIGGDPYAVLKLRAGASAEDIQKAYRERMRFCHPDRWERGSDYREMHRQTTLKSAAINAAYTSLSERRGIQGADEK